MDKVCCQRLYLHGHYYLIVDYYSMFIAVENLQNPQLETVINKCKKVFLTIWHTQRANYGQQVQIFKLLISFIFKNLGHNTQNN